MFILWSFFGVLSFQQCDSLMVANTARYRMGRQQSYLYAHIVILKLTFLEPGVGCFLLILYKMIVTERKSDFITKTEKQIKQRFIGANLYLGCAALPDCPAMARTYGIRITLLQRNDDETETLDLLWEKPINNDCGERYTQR
uniref:Uncharacterized protein n=1 Tax=Glossina palpalis gambiensis TaxID=67801 RepID=A0A1B0AN12_9MUSC